MSKEVELDHLHTASTDTPSPAHRLDDKPQQLDNRLSKIAQADKTYRHRSEPSIGLTKAHADTSDRADSTPQLPLDMERRHVSVRDSIDRSVPRTSTQMTRRTRQSVEFDRRTDGPFGRPSITMTRRASQHDTVLDGLPPVPQDVADGQTHIEATADGVLFQPEPPPLNYDLWSRKWWIIFFWSFVIFDTIICPVGLYFGLWYGLYVEGKMSANTVFTIVTAALGGAAIIDFVLRSYRLVWRTEYRVIDAKGRWTLDFFHWSFLGGWGVILVLLIASTVQDYPPPRVVAMCCPAMLYVFAIELFVLDLLRLFQIPSPIRLSSIPKGSQVRPCIYVLIEDIVAVDGSGTTEFRRALNVRYEASHVFRAMLRRVGLFWSTGSLVMAVVCTILVFTLPVDAAYTVGWSAPFVWAGIWAAITVVWVKKSLKREKVEWRRALEEKTTAASV